MKFYSIDNYKVDKKDLMKDYEEAYAIDNIRLGKDNVFFRTGFKTYYIPYDKIYRYFRRIKVIPARFCCGKFNLELEHLVICNKKKELAEIQLSGNRASKALMERLKQLAPNAKIGIKKDRKKKLKQEMQETV